jgi:hypothetical protein
MEQSNGEEKEERKSCCYYVDFAFVVGTILNRITALAKVASSIHVA